MQAGAISDDICDLLGENPSVQTCGEMEDEGGMLPIHEGWRSGSNPKSQRTPSWDLRWPVLPTLIL